MELGLVFWFVIMGVSLVVLLKGADWLLDSSENIGIAFGLPSFVIGALLVAMGTSLPELASSVVAIIEGANEIVAANVIGSNIANILLVVGLTAVVSKKITVTKNLIDLELPLLIVSTVLFLGVAYDGLVVPNEALLLFAAYFVYLLYSLMDDEGSQEIKKKKKIATKDIVLFFVGALGIAFGAKYLIDSVIAISEILDISPGIISMSAVALGTSLPELLVSIKAAMKGKPEVALGNVFGSNAFNVLMIGGIVGLFTELPLDEKTYLLGLPALAISTFVFMVSGISKRIHSWEGAMFLIFYVFFSLKLFELI